MVQLLVPLENVGPARAAQKLYKESIAPFNQRENTFAAKVHAHPTKIYVPAAMAQSNLSFLQNLSSSSVWANAPESVRSPEPSTPRSKYQAPAVFKQAGTLTPVCTIATTRGDAESQKKPSAKRKKDSSSKGILNPGLHPVLHSDDTPTTNLMTNTLGTNQAKFI